MLLVLLVVLMMFVMFEFEFWCGGLGGSLGWEVRLFGWQFQGGDEDLCCWLCWWCWGSL